MVGNAMERIRISPLVGHDGRWYHRESRSTGHDTNRGLPADRLAIVQLGEWVVRSHDDGEDSVLSARPSIARSGLAKYRPLLSAYGYSDGSNPHIVTDQKTNYMAERYRTDVSVLSEITKVAGHLEEYPGGAFVFFNSFSQVLEITWDETKCNWNAGQTKDFTYTFNVKRSTHARYHLAMKERRRLARIQRKQKRKEKTESSSEDASENSSTTTLAGSEVSGATKSSIWSRWALSRVLSDSGTSSTIERGSRWRPSRTVDSASDFNLWRCLSTETGSKDLTEGGVPTGSSSSESGSDSSRRFNFLKKMGRRRRG